MKSAFRYIFDAILNNKQLNNLQEQYLILQNPKILDYIKLMKSMNKDKIYKILQNTNLKNKYIINVLDDVIYNYYSLVGGGDEDNVLFNKIYEDNKSKLNDFTKYIYELVDNNKEFLDLSKYNQNHYFRKNIFNEYIKNIDPKYKDILNYMNLYKYIYDNVTYISNFDTIIKINENIEEINTKYSDYEHIILLNRSSLDNMTQRSNFYFTLYFIYKYTLQKNKLIENIFIDLNNMFNNLNNILIIEDGEYIINDKLKQFTDKKLLFIICDDFVYSGEQVISYNFTPLKRKLEPLKINKNIKFYLNIIGISPNIYNKIEDLNIIETSDDKNIIIPSKIIKIDLYENIIYDYFYIYINYLISEYIGEILISEYIGEILNNDKLSIENKINNLIKFNDLTYITKDKNGNIIFEHNIQTMKSRTLTYLDFKYPDFISTVPSLCKFNILKKGYYIINNKFNNLEDYNNIFKSELFKHIIKIKWNEPDIITKKYNFIIYYDEDIYYNKSIFVKNPNDDEKQDLSKTIQLINNYENDAKDCQETIKAFYKTINYKGDLNLIKKYNEWLNSINI